MTTRLSLFALAFLLPLAACETEEVEPIETDADVVAVDPIDTPMTDEVTVEGTIAAAGDDITALAPAAALDNINGWIDRLDGADFQNATEIREGLMTLRDQLQEAPLNGAAIGETLTNLGTWTVEAAGGTGDLATLGNALQSAGQNLTGM
jgi:hypothetical protein